MFGSYLPPTHGCKRQPGHHCTPLLHHTPPLVLYPDPNVHRDDIPPLPPHLPIPIHLIHKPLLPISFNSSLPYLIPIPSTSPPHPFHLSSSSHTLLFPIPFTSPPHPFHLSSPSLLGEMISKLTLTYNRTRQAVITKELIEIISGAATV